MERLDEKDPTLWRIAQKRAGFKKSLFSYLAVNGFLWLIWLYTDHNFDDGVPWPVWVMIAWGLRLAFHYHEAYHGSKNDLAEREYKRMIHDKKL